MRSILSVLPLKIIAMIDLSCAISKTGFIIGLSTSILAWGLGWSGDRNCPEKTIRLLPALTVYYSAFVGIVQAYT